MGFFFWGGGVVVFSRSQNFERKLWENWSEPCKLNILFLSTSKISNFPPPLIDKPGFLGVIHVWTKTEVIFLYWKIL